MNKKTFIEIISQHQKIFDEFHELNSLGFDFYEGQYKLADKYDNIFNIIFEYAFKVDGVDWINWFIWENNYGTKKLEATDENGTPICYSVESLYDYVKQYLKK
jgi:hypothetical protein